MSIRTRVAALSIVDLSAISLTVSVAPAAGAGARHFKRNNTLYRANNGPRNYTTGEYDLDRDNDHIACAQL